MLKKKDLVGLEDFPVVTLNPQLLASALNVTARDARDASDQAAEEYRRLSSVYYQPVDLDAPFDTALRAIARRTAMHFDAVKKLSTAQRYNHLAVIAEYIRDTRLPFLSPVVEFKLLVSDRVHADFLRLLDAGSDARTGRDYSIEALSYMPWWFEGMVIGIDEHIPKWRIHKTATEKKRNIIAALKTQTHDDYKYTVAVEILQKSEYGKSILREADSYGYQYYFIDLKPYNMIARDRGKATAAALCNSDRHIFVDIYTPHDTYRAIKLGHECLHAVEFYRHFEFGRYEDAPLEGVRDNIRQFAAIMEGHCIGGEFKIASQLLATGWDSEQVATALHYDLPSETIDLLRHDPAQFIHAVATSDVVREGWKFKKNQLRISPRIIKEFASSLPPLDWGMVRADECEGKEPVSPAWRVRMTDIMPPSSPDVT